MTKTAILFSGQGAQSVGMGLDLYNTFPSAKEVFDKANDALGVNIKDICFNGPREDLDKTINTQPAIFTYNMAAYYALGKPKVDYVCGHSLGEVCAAVASDSLSLDEGFAAIKNRAQLMQSTAEKVDTGMIAVIGLSSEEILESIKGIDDVYLSNFNNPLQTTISGSHKGLNEAKEILKLKARMVVELAVSGAFHSPYMDEAANNFSQYLNKVNFSEPSTSLIANFDAREKSTANDIKTSLIEQVNKPVQFVKMLEFLKNKHVSNYIEIGPGKVLANLVKRFNKDSIIYSTDNLESISETQKLLNTVKA